MANSLSDTVEKRLLKARIGLSLKHPFLSAAVMRLPIKDATDMPWCQTMATDGYHVFFHAPWVAELEDDEIQGVLAHEVLHVVFGHSDRRNQRHHQNWNIACDLAINVLLKAQGLALPISGLFDPRYRGMSADQIYATLTGHQDEQSNTMIARQKDIGASINDRKSRRAGGHKKIQSEIGADLLDPDNLQISPLQDDDALDLQSRRELRRQLVDEMRSALHGDSPAMMRQEIELATNKSIDWQAMLRSWLTERVRSDWSMYPFAKKHLWRGIYLPSVGVQAPGHIVFAIDTSGSMSQQDIADIAREVGSLRDMFHSRLTVVQCDAAIRSVEEYDADDPTPIPEKITALGRGGTDFRPLFRFVDKHDGAPQLIIYATDGFGHFPEYTPEAPCLWMLTANSIAAEKLPFGYAIKMGNR